MFVYSGLPWTTIRNECTKWRRWLDSDEAKTLSTDNYSSSSFWKGTLPPYRETIDIDDNSNASPDSFHSIDDDEAREGNRSTQDDMILSGSIVNSPSGDTLTHSIKLFRRISLKQKLNNFS